MSPSRESLLCNTVSFLSIQHLENMVMSVWSSMFLQLDAINLPMTYARLPVLAIGLSLSGTRRRHIQSIWLKSHTLMLSSDGHLLKNDRSSLTPSIPLMLFVKTQARRLSASWSSSRTEEVRLWRLHDNQCMMNSMYAWRSLIVICGATTHPWPSRCYLLVLVDILLSSPLIFFCVSFP